ncbi:hypothetical protein ACFLZI_01650 [Nitrospirota bacterium]
MRILRVMLSVLTVIILSMALMACGGSSSNGGVVAGADGLGSATVSGTLTLPAAQSGKDYMVFIDTDDDGGNGFPHSVAGTCGASTTVSYSFPSAIPSGNYYVYALVYVVGPGGAPVAGDYYGVYGNQTDTPAALIPASGSVTFDMTMVNYTP